jgi:anti-sigma factor RsiW
MTEHPDRETLSAFVDGELEPADSERVDAHLDECADCGEFVRAVKGLKHGVARLEAEAQPPAAVRTRVQTLARRHRGDRSPRWRWIGLVAAVVVGGAALAVAGWPRSSSSLAHALVADHLRSVPSKKPPEVASGDPDTVRRFFAGRLPFEPQAPNLPDSELLGGRLCTIKGHTMELLFYEHESKTLSLFVSRTADGVQGCERSLGHHVCRRRAGDVSMMLVGEMPPDRMNRLLQRARP